MTPRSRTAAFAALSLSLLILPACESSDDDAGATQSAGATPAQATPQPINESALSVGDTAPNVSFMTATGGRVRLTGLGDQGIIVLNFYRGNWCPYCNDALDQWDRDARRFTDEGAIVAAVSPESLTHLRKTASDHRIMILSDPDHAASKAFGINFTVDAETQEKYKGYNIDLARHNESRQWDLPVPATFVIDNQGVIRYAYANPDYKARADPEEVLQVVRRLSRSLSSGGIQSPGVGAGSIQR